jgi:hypothetical protein
MTGDEPVRPSPPARTAQFRVRDDNTASPHRTLSQTAVVPPVDVAEELMTAAAVEEPAIEEPHVPAPAAFDATETIAAAQIDRHILADAPIAEAPAAEAPPVEEPAVAAAAEIAEETVLAPSVEPDIDFSRTEKPQKVEPEVKTVKVRSSVDVMAELEALRKRATNTTPRAPKRDVLADLASLRPKRDLHRTLHLQIPPDVLPRSRSVRVTLSFEDSDEGIIQTEDQQLDLGDVSDVQSLSVNLKIDLA